MLLLQRWVLMRVFRPSHLDDASTWAEIHQVIVPQSARKAIIQLAHDGKTRHLGIKKTRAKVFN